MKKDRSKAPILLGDLPKWNRWALGLVGFVLFVIFALVHLPSSSHSLVSWAWAACSPRNGYAHGRLVPPIFLLMIWGVWQRNRDAEITPSFIGLGLLGLGLFLVFAGFRAFQPRIALAGAPFIIIGLAQMFFGMKIAKFVIGPALFLLFVIPVPGLLAPAETTASTWVTKVVSFCAGFFGYQATDHGSILTISGSEISFAEG